MIKISPCPRCGSTYLAKGRPFTVKTPKVIRKIFSQSFFGVTCCNCGYWKPSVKEWNRRYK